MRRYDGFSSRPSTQMDQPLAIVLGTNEIASAVAVYLRRSGRAVVLAHDPLMPVIRRGMAFHDALYGDFACVEDIKAKRADYLADLLTLFEIRDLVVVSRMSVTDLMEMGQIEVLVDARMLKRVIKPDFRGLARTTVGLGPGFRVKGNCDVAIETRPGGAGIIVPAGGTKAYDQSMASVLGGIGRERFIYAPKPGRWRTAIDIGARVFKDVVIGHLDGVALSAPMDGILRGLARDDCDVPEAVKIAEIDPRGRACRWTGMDERCQAIAQAVIQATRQRETSQALQLHAPSG